MNPTKARMINITRTLISATEPGPPDHHTQLMITHDGTYDTYSTDYHRFALFFGYGLAWTDVPTTDTETEP